MLEWYHNQKKKRCLKGTMKIYKRDEWEENRSRTPRGGEGEEQ